MSGSPSRAMRRAQERRQRVGAVDALGEHIKGFQVGFNDGYFQALADLLARNVVDEVADGIVAVHHDRHEQARYVLEKAQRAMTPRNKDAFRQGIERATAKYLQDINLLPRAREVEDEQTRSTGGRDAQLLLGANQEGRSEERGI